MKESNNDIGNTISSNALKPWMVCFTHPGQKARISGLAYKIGYSLHNWFFTWVGRIVDSLRE